MPIEIPACCDTQYELLRKILLTLPDIGTGISTTLQCGSQDIGLGVDTVSVVFPTAYASAPCLVISISRPSGEFLMFANIDEASITTLGFTASLSGLTQSANYKLKWFAN